MKRGLDKKGLNQIDWVISLGIFLIYMSWFFIFLKPQIQKTSEYAPIERIIKENFKNNAYYSVEKYPVFIQSEQIRNYSMVFLNFTINNHTNYAFSEDIDYFYYNNKILILQNFNNDTQFVWVVESKKNYTHTNNKLDLVKVNNTITTSKRLSAKFDKGLLKSLSFNNKNISNMSYKVNSKALNPVSNNFTDYNILLEYSAILEPVSIYTRVIAKNSVIWTSLEKNDEDAENNVLIQHSLNNFNNFYSDNTNFGSLINTCQNYVNSYLKFYNNDYSVSFLLPTNTSIFFCENNSVTSLELIINVDEQKDFFIVLDTPSFKKENFTNYKVLTGVKRIIKGIDRDYLLNLDYNTKKNEWGVPSENNYQIIIYNSTLNNLNLRNITFLILGEPPLTSKEIYVDEYRDFILNSYGELSEVTVNIGTW